MRSLHHHHNSREVGSVRSRSSGQITTLITGGAGFVGTNVAGRLLEQGERVIIYDSLARPGVEKNINWLRHRFGDAVEVRLADIRNRYALYEAVQRVQKVFHFAGQVAVTTSLDNPREDFEINMVGTLNLLEAIRQMDSPPSLLFTSTNKVYGQMNDIALQESGSRYEPQDQYIRNHGIGEERSLDFHSPYGCSKGGADQYVVDYARTYGLSTVVFRMSCIYGEHQLGTEDQGWVAHFLIQALKGNPITIYGDGMQVRDVLYVGDLVDAMLLAQQNASNLAGKAFSIGGGAENTLSLIELTGLIEEMGGVYPQVQYADWRIGDQKYYVSNYSAFNKETSWKPKVSVSDGVQRLYRWLQKEYDLRPEGVIARESTL
ncbi:MAG: GDP-mannose 4,6-dehydratase [Chitinivibrionales bacterium]